MTNLVESTLTEVLVEEADGFAVDSVESSLIIETPQSTTVTEAEEVTLIVEPSASDTAILAETTVTETLTESLIETLYAIEPETFLLDVGAQGPAGPQGPSGTSVSYPGKTLTYTGDKLTEVFSYSDAGKTTLVERRVLGYTGNTLTTIQFYDGTGALTKTRTLTYSSGVLSGYTDL